MKVNEFLSNLRSIAERYKTLYVMGGIGSPLNRVQAERLLAHDAYNRRSDRAAKIQAAVYQDPPVFAFDCAGVIKAVLWGWNGDAELGYGGAKYASNDVPDIGANTMISRCSELSTDFSQIMPGEVVWMEGHIGVYVGGGLAVECTPIWADGVQYTACNRDVSGYPRRDWTKHGKLNYLDYTPQETEGVFEDVAQSNWFYQDVVYCKDNGLMDGTGEGKFQPNSPVKRCELAAVAARLHRSLMGILPESSGDPDRLGLPDG